MYDDISITKAHQANVKTGLKLMKTSYTIKYCHDRKKKGFYNDPKLINLPFFFLANSITHHKSKESTKTNLIREIQKVLIHLFFLLGEKKKLSLKLVVKIKSCLKISTRPKKKKNHFATQYFLFYAS